jgi:RNA recognition motif-containing protein
MGRRLYVGNLPYKATDEELTALFSSAGAVTSAHVMRDMATGRARGFGFIEMASDDAAQKAIDQFNEYEMDGRKLVVNEAKPKPEGGGGRGFGGAGGGGGFGRGGNRGGGDDFGGGGKREPRW